MFKQRNKEPIKYYLHNTKHNEKDVERTKQYVFVFVQVMIARCLIKIREWEYYIKMGEIVELKLYI